MRLIAPLLAALVIAAPLAAQDRYWQCAAFARQFSGLQIRADAHDWWGKAQGRYRRGWAPRVGAVMAFTPYGPMRLGHVATVTAVLGPRDVTVTHANWSPIDGTRGHIEYDVPVHDVSDANDWSRVRVWFAPLSDLGTTAWPVTGFIYPEGDQRPPSSPPRAAYMLGGDVRRQAAAEQEALPPPPERLPLPAQADPETMLLRDR